MLYGGRFGVGKNANRTQYPANVSVSFSFECARGAFRAVPQFSNGDCGNLELLIWLRGHPSSEVEGFSFVPNNDVGIEDYRHRSTGGFNILRARCRSFRHAFAFSGDNSISRRASANSRPVQRFSSVGTSRATGEPFLSRTKVIF